MDNSTLASGIDFGSNAVIVVLLVCAAAIALTMLLAWVVIRSAVRRAIWDHENGVGRPRR